MTATGDLLALADWRRTIAEMYTAVRSAPESGRRIAWQDWRARRNALFKEHPQTPLSPRQREAFRGLPYFDHDPAWRLIGQIDREVAKETFEMDLGPDGAFRFSRLARVVFVVGEREAELNLYWIEGYGGGVFLPFKDKTNGAGSYGGGRYLYDTLKGVDLGLGHDVMVLDFNYAYNPSCAYHPRWTCPLPPYENTLPLAVAAGEQAFAA